ncbi:hypothetical protein [Kitasatospora sp. DSM 101779]|jgi:hypothetical protein|uniref:hypothetical protein n=1 Tax=Kitasatospora sp. DSM 101779 TaxID=2853165 RepID=UPI0021DA9611|nr:hypothetical protein [Kitasatospora sp. DSM 101779]MCU7825957.1 hypothetical protein [Kitasatospora sp. DSM 101779]
MDDDTTDTIAGSLRQLEGYLLWQAEVATAQRDATAFTEQFPWLTTGQREEIARAYAQKRLEVSRLTVTHIAQRCRDLRSEYEDRYRRLRFGLVALLPCAAALGAAAAAVATRSWP